MDRGDLQLLADQKGHSTNIHTTVYRLQQNLIKRSKMARLLIASEAGLISKFKERTDMDNINLNTIPVPIDGMTLHMLDNYALSKSNSHLFANGCIKMKSLFRMCYQTAYDTCNTYREYILHLVSSVIRLFIF